jgi:hypothetical protein
MMLKVQLKYKLIDAYIQQRLIQFVGEEKGKEMDLK